MQIGELARRFGATVEAIRYYEREGLLPKPQRTAGNYRVYNEAHARQLSFILNCRSLDMSHEEIKALLRVRTTPATDCGDVNQLIDGHIEQVSRRICELNNLLTELRALRESCSEARSVQQCSILSRLARSSSRSTRAPAARRARRG